MKRKLIDKTQTPLRDDVVEITLASFPCNLLSIVVRSSSILFFTKANTDIKVAM